MDNKINTTIFQIIKWNSFVSIISIILMYLYFMLSIKLPEQIKFIIGILGIFTFYVPFISLLLMIYLLIIKAVNRYNLDIKYSLKYILFLLLINFLFLAVYVYWGLIIEGEE